MGRKGQVDYDSMTVICNGTPSKESLKNYYNLLIDYNIQRYGKETVKQALEELITEKQ
ncbi:hypothetical protein ACTFIN_01785 [Clostridium cagae]|uniref:hypothetical protein n=1 Tax=Clostridium cagae TaxID=2080751 RepID=UPI003F764A39